jgi:molybdenum cofactor biosynthesis enzyme MoaA
MKSSIGSIRLAKAIELLQPRFHLLTCTGLRRKRVGLATNGAASLTLYRKLWEAGVDDFSISLDADNAVDGAALSGSGPDVWRRVVRNIREIAAFTQVTIGLVFNETNLCRASDIIQFALDLGVADVPAGSVRQASIG